VVAGALALPLLVGPSMAEGFDLCQRAQHHCATTLEPACCSSGVPATPAPALFAQVSSVVARFTQQTAAWVSETVSAPSPGDFMPPHGRPPDSSKPRSNCSSDLLTPLLI
jgi:hypothetical protein